MTKGSAGEVRGGGGEYVTGYISAPLYSLYGPGAVFIDLRASELALSRIELLFIDRCSMQYLYAIGYLKECRAAS